MLIQFAAIWYLLILTSGYLTSDTGAYFNDSSQVNGNFQVGTWQEVWDKSSLAFPNKDQTVTGVRIDPNTCQQIEISTDIINNGSAMQGNSTYEVYYIASGNPKSGQKVGDGVITPILSGKSEKLKYLATKPGNYKFRAFQRPGHANNYNTQQDLWSETITLACPDKTSNVNLQSQSSQPSNAQSSNVTVNQNLNSSSNVQNTSIEGTGSQNVSNTTDQPQSQTNNQSGSTTSIDTQSNETNSTSP